MSDAVKRTGVDEGTSIDYRELGVMLSAFLEIGQANHRVLCEIRDAIKGQILPVPVASSPRQDASRATIEARMIMLIPETRGNISDIAERAGVTRTMIYKKGRFPRFWEYLESYRRNPIYRLGLSATRTSVED